MRNYFKHIGSTTIDSHIYLGIGLATLPWVATMVPLLSMHGFANKIYKMHRDMSNHIQNWYGSNYIVNGG